MLVPIAGDIIKKQLPSRRRIGVFGSTGSIGISALEIVERNRDRFEVFCLVAGSNIEKLAEQVKVFSPAYVGIGDESKAGHLRKLIQSVSPQCELVVGAVDIAALAAHPSCDIVLGAIVGISGLQSVFEASRAGKIIALANKESLVCGGGVLREVIRKSGACILPVDSEHSALFQSLQGNHSEDIQKLILTASGGPFLKTPIESFSTITPAQALNHPRWKMGPKVTIDSSTMFNKALELIEAHWLFDVPEHKIDVVVHPQSIVHSLVEYKDGSQIAQLSNPDMKGPISFALSYPEKRVTESMIPLDLSSGLTLEFLPLESNRFPAVGLAREVLKQGTAAGVVFNAADEVAVGNFLAGKMNYIDILPMISKTLDRFSGENVDSLDGILCLDAEVRSFLVNSNKAS